MFFSFHFQFQLLISDSTVWWCLTHCYLCFVNLAFSEQQQKLPGNVSTLTWCLSWMNHKQPCFHETNSPSQESSRTWMTAPRSISITWERRTLHRLATLWRVNGHLHSLYMGNTTGHGGLTVEASPWKAASALEMRDFWDTWRKDHPWKRGMIWRWLSTSQRVVSTELDESTMLIYEHGSVLRRHRGRRWGVARKCRLWRQTCPSFLAKQLCHRMEGVIVLALHCPQPKSRCGLL